MKVKFEFVKNLKEVFGLLVGMELFALVIFLIRLPFCDDNILDFLKIGFMFWMGSVVLTLIVGGFVILVSRSQIIAAVVLAVFVFSVFSSCHSDRGCIESRYIQC